ncbi:MAG: FmdB family zinc ribbon protein [Acidimicrobiales bacterium]
MPTYEYVCSACGEHLEVVQSFRDDPLTECPVCGGDLRKVFGNIGIVFKGSGFYKTDSRSSSGSKASSSTSTPSGSSGSEHSAASASADAHTSAPATGKPAAGEKAANSKPAKTAAS